MENFIMPIEYEGQVVITTAQLAEVYGTTSKNITNNFQRNSDRFTEGKHYFVLKGDELKEYKSKTSERGVPVSSANSMYLWTRRGASRHCKILGTDKAWEQFDYLEDNYFDRKPQLPDLSDPMKLLEVHYEAIKQVNQKVDTLTDRMDRFENDLPLFPEEADNVSGTVKKRVVEVLGGKASNAYHDKSISQMAFMDAYRNLKRNFNVRSYKCIKRSQINIALQIAKEYEPPVFLANEIAQANSQIKLDL